MFTIEIQKFAHVKSYDKNYSNGSNKIFSSFFFNFFFWLLQKFSQVVCEWFIDDEKRACASGTNPLQYRKLLNICDDATWAPVYVAVTLLTRDRYQSREKNSQQKPARNSKVRGLQVLLFLFPYFFAQVFFHPRLSLLFDVCLYFYRSW